MPDPLATINTRVTPQSERADSRQVPNAAGGFGFQIGDMARLRRFLVLGTEGGTYYTGERELTKANADLVLTLARTRGLDVVGEILSISVSGRAPKQNPTLFALAAVAGLGDEEARKAALAALPAVARTGTMLFTFAKYVEQFRGWGRGLRSAVGRWYTEKDPEKLAYQLIKYRQRDGWTHRDLLRLSHPEIGDPARESALRGALSFGAGKEIEGAVPKLIEGFLKAQSASSAAETSALVQRYRLPWEALQPEHLTSPSVWASLLDNGMPQTALLRNLPRLTTLGLIGPSGAYTQSVARQLATGMSKAKVHPVNVLIAMRTYAGGRSLRGMGTWTPNPKITDALDAGFYEAFGGVERSGKRTLLVLDVSGSMGMAQISGLPITPREASAAIAMVTAATEENVTVVGFTDGTRGGGWSTAPRSYGFGGSWERVPEPITPLDFSARRRLDDIVASVAGLNFGATDLAMPWVWAQKQGLEFDSIISFTDNETWSGTIHPHQAMRQYRERTGLATRSVIVAMTATNVTVNDPNDPLGLDVAGFDSAVPNLIADFSAGRI